MLQGTLKMMPTAATAQMMNDILYHSTTLTDIQNPDIMDPFTTGTWTPTTTPVSLAQRDQVVQDLQEAITDFLTFSTTKDLMKLIAMTL